MAAYEDADDALASAMCKARENVVKARQAYARGGPPDALLRAERALIDADAAAEDWAGQRIPVGRQR